MTPEDRAEFGIEGDWPVGRRHRIRWSECDALGHANNVAYLTLCEDLRVGPGWSALGGTFAPGSVSPVVAQMEARYLKSLVFEEEAMVTLRFAAVKRTSFVHEYAVWRQGPLLRPAGRSWWRWTRRPARGCRCRRRSARRCWRRPAARLHLGGGRRARGCGAGPSRLRRSPPLTC